MRRHWWEAKEASHQNGHVLFTYVFPRFHLERAVRAVQVFKPEKRRDGTDAAALVGAKEASRQNGHVLFISTVPRGESRSEEELKSVPGNSTIM